MHIIRHAVRKGSLLLALDVISTGSALFKGVDGDTGVVASLVPRTLPIKLWFEWLQLPWPKDGGDVLVQVRGL